MGFWNFFKTKKKDNQDPDDNFISEETSLDLIFAKNFTESGGRFIFLDKQNSSKIFLTKLLKKINGKLKMFVHT